jgi:hypothetical protein
MQGSSNGWIRLALLISAAAALISSIGTIAGFVSDLEAGSLRWSVS